MFTQSQACQIKYSRPDREFICQVGNDQIEQIKFILKKASAIYLELPLSTGSAEPA